LVAFAKLVYVIEMLGAQIPLRRIRKLLATIATDIVPAARSRAVERCFYPRKSGTRPAVTTEVKGVLMPLCFVLVLESGVRRVRGPMSTWSPHLLNLPVRAISTCILLFGLVQPKVFFRVEFLRLLRTTFTDEHPLQMRRM
jgi:hypothetical protein